MEARISRTSKARWAEKTPGHLKRFPMIRQYFPLSPVICIIRDPRDVALSLLAVPWGTTRFIDGLILWRSFFNFQMQHIHGDKRTLTVRYEDLVQKPTVTAEVICQFLGEDYDPTMLDTSASSFDVGGSLEPYKKDVSGQIDGSRAFAWRQRLTKEEIALCDTLLRDTLCEFNYHVPCVSDVHLSASLSDELNGSPRFYRAMQHVAAKISG